MNARLNTAALFLSITLMTIAFNGCRASSYEKQQFLLETQRQEAARMLNSQNVLEIRRFTIDPAFSDKGLTYRTGEFEFQTDFYNEFLVSPAEMITEKTREWLSASGLFEAVSESGSLIEPTHLIEANITSLYGDYTDKVSPKAVMEIRLFLLEAREWNEPNIVFNKSYKSEMQIYGKGPAALVKALDMCFTEILTNLENDIAEKL